MSRDYSDDYYEEIHTLLNIGDTVVLYSRNKHSNDTIIYNGGPLIYKDEDTALAFGDTLRILELWAEEKESAHNPAKQDTVYNELLDSIINAPNFLNNLKVFLFS